MYDDQLDIMWKNFPAVISLVRLSFITARLSFLSFIMVRLSFLSFITASLSFQSFITVRLSFITARLRQRGGGGVFRVQGIHQCDIENWLCQIHVEAAKCCNTFLFFSLFFSPFFSYSFFFLYIQGYFPIFSCFWRNSQKAEDWCYWYCIQLHFVKW